MNNIDIDFKFLCNKLIEMSEFYGHIPTKIIIDKESSIPRVDKVRCVFKENGYNSYTDFLIEKGYKIKCSKSTFDNYTLEMLIDLWEKYFEDNGKYPRAEDCLSEGLPNWSRVKIICGDKFKEFYENYGTAKNVKTRSFEYYCGLFKEICIKLGRTLTSQDLLKNEFGLPNQRWLIKNCPDENVKDYNDFVNYLGLKPYYNVFKDYATKKILKKYNELNKNIKLDDFRNPIGEEIGIGTINNLWGSFNNMLKDLDIPINQEGMADRQRPLEQLKNDIIKLCNHINNNENRTVISREDVNNCEWCLSAGTYDRWFKRELNMTLTEYIESIGFQGNKAGMGMIHEFEDGEVATSQFEYKISVYLKGSNVKYNRNINYKDFIKGYCGNKDCDYVIYFGKGTWYIEVAGMLDYTKVSKKKDDYIREKYKKDLSYKEEMLIDNNLNYKIIYPSNLKEKSLDEIFSFLHN